MFHVCLLHLIPLPRSDQARTDKALQPAGMRMQERPIVDRQIDDDEARSRQLLVRAVRAYPRRPMRSIASRDRAGPDYGRRLASVCALRVSPMTPISAVGSGIVDALVGDHRGALAKAAATSAQVSCARFAGETRARSGSKAVMRHIGADRRRVGAAAFHELAVAVALARARRARFWHGEAASDGASR